MEAKKTGIATSQLCALTHNCPESDLAASELQHMPHD